MSGAFNLENVLKALSLVGSATPAVAELVNLVTPLLDQRDQATLREALKDAQAENDAGHLRLQQKLADAAKR